MGIFDVFWEDNFQLLCSASRFTKISTVAFLLKMITSLSLSLSLSLSHTHTHTHTHRFVGLVVRRPRERKVPSSNPACAGIFSGSSHTSVLNIGTPVATLPGAWRYRVSTGTGRPGVSIL